MVAGFCRSEKNRVFLVTWQLIPPFTTFCHKNSALDRSSPGSEPKSRMATASSSWRNETTKKTTSKKGDFRQRVDDDDDDDVVGDGMVI